MTAPRIVIENVTVVLSGREIVCGTDVFAGSGEVTGIVGPNGSGKSTLLRVIYRHLKPTAGRIVIGDDDLSHMSAPAAARLVAAVPQERGSEFDSTVREVVALGRIPHQGRFGGESEADKRAITDALSQVRMSHFQDRTFASLSGGERQRVLLARCFAQGGRVLVLDEPTNHLDVSHQTQLLGMLKRRRVTTVIALHDLNAAAEVCDRVYVVCDGAVVQSGIPEDVFTESLLSEVFGVRATVLQHPRTGKPLIAFDYLGEEP